MAAAAAAAEKRRLSDLNRATASAISSAERSSPPGTLQRPPSSAARAPAATCARTRYGHGAECLTAMVYVGKLRRLVATFAEGERHRMSVSGAVAPHSIPCSIEQTGSRVLSQLLQPSLAPNNSTPHSDSRLAHAPPSGVSPRKAERMHSEDETTLPSKALTTQSAKMLKRLATAAQGPCSICAPAPPGAGRR